MREPSADSRFGPCAQVGVIVSVCLSLVLCVKQSTAMRIKILGRVPNTTLFEPLDDDDEHDDGLLSSLSEEVPGVLIVRIRDGALTFANTGAMKERLRRLERYGHGRHHPSEEPRRAEASVVIFHLADVGEVDASALQIMRELVGSYTARSVLVRLARSLCLARSARWVRAQDFDEPFFLLLLLSSPRARRSTGPSARPPSSLACAKPASSTSRAAVRPSPLSLSSRSDLLPLPLGAQADMLSPARRLARPADGRLGARGGARDDAARHGRRDVGRLSPPSLPPS